MNTALRLAKPIFYLAAAAAFGKAFWLALGGPELLIRVHSLTLVEFAGALYLTMKVVSTEGVGIRHLWLANSLVFAWCHALFLISLGAAWMRRAPQLLYENEFLVPSWGPPENVVGFLLIQAFHWTILAPAIVTWISGAPVLLLRRLAERS